MTKKFIIFLFGFLLIIGCKEEVKAPLTAGEKPAAIKEYAVENLAGAAEISYKIPDNNVAYVIAEYEIKEGVKSEARSSKYKDKLRIEGFPKAGEYQVNLIAVGRNEQQSEPITLTVNPDDPPVLKAFEKLRMQATFGGVSIRSENIFESDLVYEVIVEDEAGNWELSDQHYSSLKDIDFSVRGYGAVEKKFGVFIRDRWLNYSDTLFSEITPYYEGLIDMSGFYETNLPGDEHKLGGTRKINYLFNGKKGRHQDGYYSKTGATMPQHFTIYLQDLYKLSRLKFWQSQPVSYAFSSHNVKEFRVWGSVDPNPDGSFDDSWILLGEFEVMRPSGNPVGTDNTAEDSAQAEEGEEAAFDIDTPPVRYIRFQTVSSWGTTQRVYITEMEFWGTSVN